MRRAQHAGSMDSFLISDDSWTSMETLEDTLQKRH
jgi:hypothetical protein